MGDADCGNGLQGTQSMDRIGNRLINLYFQKKNIEERKVNININININIKEKIIVIN